MLTANGARRSRPGEPGCDVADRANDLIDTVDGVSERFGCRAADLSQRSLQGQSDTKQMRDNGVDEFQGDPVLRRADRLLESGSLVGRTLWAR